MNLPHLPPRPEVRFMFQSWGLVFATGAVSDPSRFTTCYAPAQLCIHASQMASTPAQVLVFGWLLWAC